MPTRSGLVAEVRLECNGHLVVAYLPSHPGAPLTPEGLPKPIHWFIEIDQGTAFVGPVYGVYLVGEEEKARDEIRGFLKDDPRAARPAKRRPA